MIPSCPNCYRGGADCRCSWIDIAAAYERAGQMDLAQIAARIAADSPVLGGPENVP